MKYTVTWRPSAFDDLANLWTDSPSGEKEEVRRVVDEIERALIRNPLNVGESRSENRRMVVEPPVAIVFDVVPDDCQVHVLEIKLLKTS